MTSASRYDVAIVGASIAGCTAATLFGRRGLRVALIERRSDPGAFKRVCTHFIQPSATPTLQRLGLDTRIEAAGGLRNSVDAWTRWGWIRTPPPDDRFPSYGYSIRREKLDPMLRELAAGTPGVELMLGLTAESLLIEGGRIAGVSGVESDRRQRDVTARLVVAADGRTSRLAGFAGVPTTSRPNNRFAYWAYFRNLSLSSPPGTSQVWLLEPDMAYTFPNDDGLTIALYAPTKEKLPAFRRDIEGSFYRLYERVPGAPRFDEAERVSDWIGILDMPNAERAAVYDGMALVGDAATTSDPVWGVGCGWAFQSAEWLVDATAGALAGKGDLDAALTRYAKRHRAALHMHHVLTSEFSSGRGYNPIEKLMISAAARDERAAQHFAAFGARSVSVREFLSPKAIARAARVNLAHRQRGRAGSAAA